MKTILAILTISLAITSCSRTQVAEFAYDSVKNKECLDKTGEISCDLNGESDSALTLIEPPSSNSNEALEEHARSIRESQK